MLIGTDVRTHLIHICLMSSPAVDMQGIYRHTRRDHQTKTSRDAEDLASLSLDGQLEILRSEIAKH